MRQPPARRVRLWRRLWHGLGRSRSAPARGRLASATPYDATRRRLVLINLGVVSTIILLMAGSIYFVESHALEQQVEQQLIARAEVEVHNDETLVALHQASPPPAGSGDNTEGDDKGEGYEPSSPNVFAVVLDAHGATLADPSRVSGVGLPDLAAAAPVLSGARDDTMVNARIHDQEYLLYSRAIVSHDQVVGAVQVGQSLAPMERQTHDLLLTLILVGLGALLVTAGASFVLADRALLPMRLAYNRQRQFAAAASHELRTPLAFVRSQLELVSRRLQRAQAGESPSASVPRGVAAEARDDLDETLNEVDYMTRLVRDLLLMARDESDHRSIAWRPVDLTALTRDVIETARPTAQRRGLTLEDTTASGDRIWVMGDYDRLRQLLLILLDNATRYTSAGGRVWVEARGGRGSRLGGRRPVAQISVGDTGIGIAPDQQQRIFEAFYRPRGHSASGGHADGVDGVDGDHGGAGLGLALARWLVTAHEGDIAVRSAPGAGSVFTASLPLLADYHANESDAASDEDDLAEAPSSESPASRSIAGDE